MNITDRPVTFPFGATNPPYSPANPHKGWDFDFKNEPVYWGGTNIATSGNSGSFRGLTYDPHLHCQGGYDEWAQQAIDCKPYLDMPGIVVKVGSAPQWGKYVCVRVGDVNVFNCHLSWINVLIGDKVGGNIMADIKIEGAPASVSWGEGRLDIFARGTDDGLWHKWYDGKFHDWERVGGGIATPPSVSSWGEGRLDIFSTGVAGDLMHLWYADGRFNGPESLGTPS